MVIIGPYGENNRTRPIQPRGCEKKHSHGDSSTGGSPSRRSFTVPLEGKVVQLSTTPRRAPRLDTPDGRATLDPADTPNAGTSLGPASVAQRLAELGLQPSLPNEDDAAPPPRTQHFTAEDPGAFMRDLEASGRFRRDTRLGSLYHPGQISLREVSLRHSLHITLGPGNKISAHVDRYSPLADRQPEHGCRYALHRIAAHNITGMAADLARLLPRRRRQP